ncbi:hypothetical protein [Sphingobium sp. TCM1]|uniref:hypothetical protein n=1 Tax=Sphingobium sp. TCM1 TaxID=453246 RepID=UPI001E6471A0|nr:hypothetical protein [Sphingobium sp. TCM1]
MIEKLGGDAFSLPSAAQLMGERATLNGFLVPGRRSAGGGCRLHDTLDGTVALTLARADDRAMLPALFGDSGIDGDDDRQIAAAFAKRHSEALVAQGRLLARLRDGRAARMILSMSAIVAQALDSERRRDEKALMADLRYWSLRHGTPFPNAGPRPSGRVAALGQDNQAWLASC